MQAIVVQIVMAIITKVIVPMIEKAVAKYTAAKKVIADYKETKAQAVKKAENYEADPSNSNANNLP